MRTRCLRICRLLGRDLLDGDLRVDRVAPLGDTLVGVVTVLGGRALKVEAVAKAVGLVCGFPVAAHDVSAERSCPGLSRTYLLRL